MIEVGVSGCDNLCAGELIRLLINHPDVELKWVSAEHEGTGMRLDSLVRGIVGECDLTVSPLAGEHDDVDLVFVGGTRQSVSNRLQDMVPDEDARVIDLSGCHNLDHGEGKPWTYGMGEMQRRVLVHDARLVTVPGNAAMASLLALMPMARNLLLNNPITLRVAMGEAAFPAEGGTATPDGHDINQWARLQQQEVTLALGMCQASFNQPVDLTITRLAERRTLAVAAQFKCGVDGEMIRQLYEQYYEDHNFVFLVDRPILTADVENTNKCLIRLDKDEHKGTLTVHAVMDTLLKGCAGTAVHAMNLMFGLHERVGLSLKASGC